MYLTYMLGCGADQQQQQELQTRSQWLQSKKQRDQNYETTKLEWAKTLTAAEMSVLEDPLKNYGQMGTGDLPPGAKAISLQQFLQEAKAEFLKQNKELNDYHKQLLVRFEDQYQPAKGMIVKNPENQGFGRYMSTRYSWYPAREAPQDEVKGLARLKGHLHQGQWLTKFRKIVRKSEMNNDIILSEVPQAQQQTYLRIMPTSPP
jgi:hypothetical protein